MGWRANLAIATAAALSATTATAQIISAILPSSTPDGQKRDKVSIHLMETPFAKWDYKEVYIDRSFSSSGSLLRTVDGIISGQPNSNFMIAGEVAFALGEGDWSLAVGGWHNAVGEYDFGLDAYFVLPGVRDVSCGTLGGVPVTGLCGPLVARVPLKLTMYEGHVGFFYKSAGLQVGFVRTQQGLGRSLIDAQWTVKLSPTDPFATVIPLGEIEPLLPPGTPKAVPEFHTTTNDLTVFAVYRRSEKRWGLSLGVGAYLKEGIPLVQDSPLRFPDDETVPSAFVTGSVNLYKGLGIDLSYWFIGKTRRVEAFAQGVDLSTSTDAQSRFTVGLGFSF